MSVPGSPAPAGGQLLYNLVLFGRLLRRLGIAVTAPQLRDLVAALAHVGLERRADVHAAARAVLVSRQEHLAPFDRAFDLFFRPWRPDLPHLDLGRIVRAAERPKPRRGTLWTPVDPASAGAAPGVEETFVERRRTYSAAEVLRRKDFAALTAAERRQVQRLLLDLTWRPAPRRTRRSRHALRGPRPDLRRSLRQSFKTGGELVRLARRKRRQKPRPIVVLCDVSGSMETYSRTLLQFVYGLSRRLERVEAFLFGTRLTRITRLLVDRDPDRALRRVAAATGDWGGGTRIGAALRTFNYVWGRRVLGQGAVVLLLSDGWDRGEPELLEREIRRLRRTCYRLIWLNPLLGLERYEPLTRGLTAALPHVDDFLPVHNLESLEQLAAVLSRLGGRSGSEPQPSSRAGSEAWPEGPTEGSSERPAQGRKVGAESRVSPERRSKTHA